MSTRISSAKRSVGLRKMNRRYGLITLVAVITILMVLVTASSLPGYIRESGNLYKPFEYAQMYLEDDPYSELIIEYDYVPGFEPSHRAMESLGEVVYAYTDKTSVIARVDDQIAFRDTKPIYTEDDIFELVDTYKSYQRGGNTMVLYVLYLDGAWKDENVLGLSFGGDRIIIFMNTIINVARRSQNLNPQDIESSVLIHEFGHLLSLVGRGYHSDHEDPDYEHHCDESAGPCVMAADIEIRMGRYSEPPPTDFCVLCQDDLEKIRHMEDDPGVEELITAVAVISIVVIGISWIVVLKPKKKDKEEEYLLYNEQYSNDMNK